MIAYQMFACDMYGHGCGQMLGSPQRALRLDVLPDIAGQVGPSSGDRGGVSLKLELLPPPKKKQYEFGVFYPELGYFCRTLGYLFSCVPPKLAEAPPPIFCCHRV